MTTIPSSAPAAPVAALPSRVASVDLIRGAVMILMAIAHVRVYSGLPAGGPTPGIFYFACRWFADRKARKRDRWLKYL